MSESELVKYYIDKTDKRLTSIESKIDDLISWKFKILGGIFAVSALVTLGFKLIFN